MTVKKKSPSAAKKKTVQKAAKSKPASKKAAKKTASKKTAATRTASRKTAKTAAPGRSGNGRSGRVKSLVIVESPAKARTLEKYLGPDFKVMASVGHVIDLPTKSLGVDVDNDFAPQYEVIKGKKSIIDSLKREARKADRIYLAPDPDREGEAIAYHIAQAIGNGKLEIHRAVFNEITRDAILEAIENPVDINLNLFNAQQARRILDRLVGYKISPLLWKKVRYGLSAGRVQSVSLRLICDREREIRAFDPVEYWTIEIGVKADSPPPFRLRLAKIDGANPEISNKDSAAKIVSEVKGKRFVVGDVIKKEAAKRPFAPFITSTLQQEASRKLRFTSRRTMRTAQRLYEGVKLGSEGLQGLITYMRTDSTRLSATALDMIRGYIAKNYDRAYLPDRARVYAKGKAAQDAHEAIRPTNANHTPKKMARYLDKDGLALYTLIWNRAVACQMADARLEKTRIEVPVGRYLFIATGSVVKFPGFLTIYEEARDEAGKTESETEGAEPVRKPEDERLPAVEKGDRLAVEKIEDLQHFTQPPPRFTEAGLIRELERQGIGRPSTYAAIISTVQDREYAEKENGSFKPTELGFIITDLLIESFPQIMDVGFTAVMERQLDEVEEGKVDWIELLRSFYVPFRERLQVADAKMRDLKAEMVPTEYVCEKCDSPMVVRWGRNGQFLACSGYPDCRNTKPIKMTEDGKYEIVKDEVTDYKCSNCGKPMVVKTGRRGRFLACSGYPECKTSRPLPIGVPCPRPGCDGELVERRSGKGRTFYSCSAYPECRFISGPLPVKEHCGVCNEERFVAGKEPRKKVFGCTREDCSYAPAYVEPKEGDAVASSSPKKRPAKKRPSKTARKKSTRKTARRTTKKAAA